MINLHNKHRSKFFIVIGILLTLMLMLRMAPADKSVEENLIESKRVEEKSAAIPKSEAATNSKTKLTSPSILSEPTPKSESAKEFTDLEVKQMRSDAIVSLSAYYTFQKNYFAEYSRYTTDLLALGYLPMGTNLSNKSGFIDSFVPSDYHDTAEHREDPNRKDNSIFEGEREIGQEKFSLSEEASKVQLASFKQYCKQGCTATDKTFEMIVVIPWGNDRYDVWIINHAKELRQVHDGLKK